MVSQQLTLVSIFSSIRKTPLNSQKGEDFKTINRHLDQKLLKRETQLATLNQLNQRLLKRKIQLVNQRKAITESLEQHLLEKISLIMSTFTNWLRQMKGLLRCMNLVQTCFKRQQFLAKELQMRKLTASVKLARPFVMGNLSGQQVQIKKLLFKIQMEQSLQSNKLFTQLKCSAFVTLTNSIIKTHRSAMHVQHLKVQLVSNKLLAKVVVIFGLTLKISQLLLNQSQQLNFVLILKQCIMFWPQKEQKLPDKKRKELQERQQSVKLQRKQLLKNNKHQRPSKIIT